MTLKNRFAIVTGANQGLGLAISEALICAGISGLMICARGEAKLKEAESTLRAKLGEGQKLMARHLRRCRTTPRPMSWMKATLAEFGRIDILVNNAGVYGPFGGIDEVDWQEWVDAITINLNGLVYACRAVIPAMKKAGYGKIINLSGGGATNPLPRVSAYAASKAAVVRFTDTLAEEMRPHHIDVNAIAPGLLYTRMTDQLLEAGPGVVGEAFFNRIKSMVEDGKTTPPEKAGALCVLAGFGRQRRPQRQTAFRTLGPVAGI